LIGKNLRNLKSLSKKLKSKLERLKTNIKSSITHKNLA
jgi:hypothetical protein